MKKKIYEDVMTEEGAVLTKEGLHKIKVGKG
jgi:hypothetical protein